MLCLKDVTVRMGELGDIYRRQEQSSKCQVGGCHGGQSRGGPLDDGGHHLSRGMYNRRQDNGFGFWSSFRYGAFGPKIIRWPIAKQGT